MARLDFIHGRQATDARSSSSDWRTIVGTARASTEFHSKPGCLQDIFYVGYVPMNLGHIANNYLRVKPKINAWTPEAAPRA